MRGKQVRELASATHAGQEYRPGDRVLINPDDKAPAYIAEIVKFLQTAHEVEMKVKWFYRPEEAIGGRKAFHGEAEVFASDHMDQAPLASVLGRCHVHSLEEYEKLDTRTEADFFSRFRYFPTTKTFKPDNVPVYCLCELPYNPDRPMVMCDGCEEWFHPQCLRLSQEELAQECFTCPACVDASANPPAAKKQRASGTGMGAAATAAV